MSISQVMMENKIKNMILRTLNEKSVANFNVPLDYDEETGIAKNFSGFPLIYDYGNLKVKYIGILRADIFNISRDDHDIHYLLLDDRYLVVMHVGTQENKGFLMVVVHDFGVAHDNYEHAITILKCAAANKLYKSIEHSLMNIPVFQKRYS